MRRYRALRFAAAVHQVFGAIVAVAGVMTIVFGLISLHAAGAKAVYFLAMAIAGFLWGMFIFAFGELIYLLINIEANTRQAALAADRSISA